jgi:sugar/nucleoside kinase (ribokinase family)
MNSSLVAHVGMDKNGEDCVDHLKKDNVGVEYIERHKHLTTNYHYVLWFQDDRTILIKHEVYPYKLPKDMAEPKWLYLSSLGDTSVDFHHEIAKYLKDHPNVKLVFQPGTFQIKLGTDVLRDIYNRTDIFFCNVEEAQQILNTESKHLPTLLHEIKRFGMKLPVITDGPAGAYTLMDDKAIFLETYPDPKPPYERTGAGDAFASTFAAAIAKGKTIPDALKWASINSMSVCQYTGAQKGLLSEAGLLDYLARAPKDWNIKYLE